MLYMPIGQNKPVRIQGCFASSHDVEATVAFVKSQVQSEFDEDIIQAVESCIPVTKMIRQTRLTHSLQQAVMRITSKNYGCCS